MQAGRRCPRICGDAVNVAASSIRDEGVAAAYSALNGCYSQTKDGCLHRQ